MRIIQHSSAMIGILIGSLFVGSFGIETITQPVTTPFGVYTPEVKPFTPSLSPYTIPNSLSNVLYADRYLFSDTVKSLLIKNGFAAVPSNAQSMTAIYKSTNDKNLPSFVTTDAVLHTFYKIYDNMLKIAEYKRFYFQLDTMLDIMISAVTPLLASSTNDSVNLAISRSAAFLDVAHTLLTDTITFTTDPTIKAMVVAETSLVYQHLGFSKSKVIPELNEDFSQYVPRGHYSLDARFQHYFRSMMYLGRMNMRETSCMETMQACILTRLLATTETGGIKASRLWANIYNPTTFFVGKNDDLCYLQYMKILDSLLVNQWRTGDLGIIRTNLTPIIVEINKLPKPLILSGLDGARGFHFMGQRFVPDSYMFGQLVYDYVGTQANPRLFPRGLDVLAVMGSERAKKHLIDLYHEDQYVNYTNQLDSLTNRFSVTPASQWAENLYWNWLYTLAPLLETTGKGYPTFMTTPAWTDKALTSASGSWAELRHATVLYAKQSYTPPVGIDCPYAVCFPQGYVEPYPETFGRIAAMVNYMLKGFDIIGLSSQLPIAKLITLSTLCTTLQNIAINELQQIRLTLGQYCEIAGAYKVLSDLANFDNYQVPPPSPYTYFLPDTSIAEIVDVHTDLNSSKVLEVGIGKPMCLYVIVPVEGKLQVCRGAMFSYYEFLHPMNDRMTDAQWQDSLEKSNPSMPVWTQNFTASKESTAYKNIKNDLATLVSTNDTIPETFYPGDSVIALLYSVSSTPTISVESKLGLMEFFGIPQGSLKYRIAIPPEALSDTNILTINSLVSGVGNSNCMSPPPIAITYRRLLVRNPQAAIIAGKKSSFNSKSPRLLGRIIHFIPGTSWRIFEARGRQVAFIGPETGQWVASPLLAHTVLIVVSVNNRLQKPIRLVIGE